MQDDEDVYVQFEATPKQLGPPSSVKANPRYDANLDDAVGALSITPDSARSQQKVQFTLPNKCSLAPGGPSTTSMKSANPFYILSSIFSGAGPDTVASKSSTESIVGIRLCGTCSEKGRKVINTAVIKS